ncbi:MAG TPA: adenylosuccinate lyase [Candidatus Aminicenantes bacterium]|nr:adenylosuccinate lyase [Candidatus Aminicenantes bacterium]HRY66335.1 adenylosuccinate lyase [Candidatus Aminicenantes bacterium]HRZ73218.1 adenylosuccinate lyase [Candidatus Aminicenantes bacterium]
MIERYTRPGMGAIWTEENRYRKWLDVELAVCQAWSRLGKIPPADLRVIREKAGFSVARIDEIEKVVKHDIIAFLTSVAEKVGPASRHIHLGLTSYDVVDTALSLLIKESLEKLLADVRAFHRLLKRQALKHKKTVCIGRTHGVHAEPITFGFKVLVWYEEIGRHIVRLEAALKTISVGRISGSVGTFIHLDPRVEVMALRKLGLEPAKVSTQVLQRDRHAEVLSALALLATTVEKIAVEVRHLQRTEVLELEEPFTKGQKGSSSMPHKKNPVRSERISGLARLVRANAGVGLEDMVLWHERDISHSSAERIVFPDSFIAADFLLADAADIVGHWVVHPGRMRANIDATRGLIFSQSVLLALTRKGLVREAAYQVVQRNSLRAWTENLDFRALVAADPDVARVLEPKEIAACFSLDPYLAKIDYIFERVLR